MGTATMGAKFMFLHPLLNNMVTTNLPYVTGQIATSIPVAPLDAQAGVDALMSSGIGTLVQFGLLMLAIILSIGSLFMIGAAGMARMSQDSGRQDNVSTYLASAAIMLGCAAVMGAGPEILSALGFKTFDHISAVNVFTG